MSDLNVTGVYQGPNVLHNVNSTIQTSSFPYASVIILPDFLSQLISFITMWRVVVLLLVLGNLKNIPLIWHVSISQAASSILYLTIK